MENKEKYTQAFVKSFSVDPAIAQTLAYNEFTAWDSLGHMGLIAEIEEVFGIQMEMDDIIDFSSYQKGIELLSKYGVSF